MKNRNMSDVRESVEAKLKDAMTPGFQVEFDPDEAEYAGAFVEDSMSEEDALASVIDMNDGDKRQEMKG